MEAIAQSHYLNQPRGLWNWIYTLDHKRIGVLYLAGIMTFFIVGGLLAMVIRLELLHPGRDLMGPDTYNQIFTLHGAIMIYIKRL